MHFPECFTPATLTSCYIPRWYHGKATAQRFWRRGLKSAKSAAVLHSCLSCRIWNALACNYGQAVPVDWRQSRTRSLYISTFNLEERLVSRLLETDDAAELSDEDELREQLDMHSIIVPCVDQEPLVTAEQVQNELTSHSHSDI
uniref:Uncharacterized protein n=1 Tax=Xiphophorus couchianus TaxID=32473 RepID=A0A3B5MD54_9TELE